MKSIPRWMIVPPAVALLLVLGPLSMQGSSSNSVAPETSTPAAPEQPESSGLRAPALPRTPDFWKIGSTLLGVLLLGGVGLYGLRRLRGGATPTRGTTLLTLRQTMRLSPRQALFAVEFEDRILVVGESERGLTLLDSGKSTTQSEDEAEVTARAAELLSAAVVDTGAVPKNMVIPRPSNGPTGRQPTLPGQPAAANRNKNLNDFRTLLQKAGRA